LHDTINTNDPVFTQYALPDKLSTVFISSVAKHLIHTHSYTFNLLSFEVVFSFLRKKNSQ